jgi:hypothetical protein
VSSFGGNEPHSSTDAELLSMVVDAGPGEPFDPRAVVFTGSDLRCVTLADGTQLIVKHLHREGDWLARATDGTDRPQQVWRSGVLTALEPVVEHGVVGLIDVGDHQALVMHDLSGWLFAPDVWLDRTDVDLLMNRLACFHELASTIDLPTSLCTIAERANLCNPAAHRHDNGRHPAPGGAQAIEGALNYLAERAGGAAGTRLAGFFDDLAGFAVQVTDLTDRPTLLHGDAKAENLGIHDDRLVAVDWGELTGVGPAEFDIVRFAFGACGYSTSLTPPEVYELYNGHVMVPLDGELVRLATLSCSVNNGIGNLATIAATTDPELKQRAKNRLRLVFAELRRLYPD